MSTLHILKWAMNTFHKETGEKQNKQTYRGETRNREREHVYKTVVYLGNSHKIVSVWAVVVSGKSQYVASTVHITQRQFGNLCKRNEQLKLLPKKQQFEEFHLLSILFSQTPCLCVCAYGCGWTDRQTDRWADGQSDRQIKLSNLYVNNDHWYKKVATSKRYATFTTFTNKSTLLHEWLRSIKLS